jgi:uncharacterized protein (TIGR00303 family)
LELLLVHAPTHGQELARSIGRLRPFFVCVVASTDTALIPGISAAGASTDLIPFTAAADAEILAYGMARSLDGVPSNPLGPPGPAIISRAALELGGIPHVVVNAGCRVNPQCPYTTLGDQPGGLISEGHAVPDARGLFERGRAFGLDVAVAGQYLVLGESVPGGTTTALALLLGLGIDAHGRVSSSMPGNAHALKSAVAASALAQLPVIVDDGLAVAQVLGDPMQPAAAGIAAGALEAGSPVLLAGGTQMAAVAALLRDTATRRGKTLPPTMLGVATTRWVVVDPTADVAGLMEEIGGDLPLLATPLSFARSRIPQMRRYEDNLVKEGVGAGGLAVAAAASCGVSCAALLDRTEEICQRLARTP